jgi:hypothetical protein
MKYAASLLLLFAAPASAAGPPTAADIEKLIVGTWLESNILATGEIARSKTTYRSDGTLVSEDTFERLDNSTKTFPKRVGTWKVVGSKLLETREPDEPAGFKGQKGEVEVVEINKRALRYRRGRDGVLNTKTRELIVPLAK